MTDHECDEALAQLYSYLDGELDSAVLANVEVHLQRCSPCLEAFDFEMQLRKVVASKCRDQMPADVKAKICDVLHQLEDQQLEHAPNDSPKGDATAPPE